MDTRSEYIVQTRRRIKGVSERHAQTNSNYFHTANKWFSVNVFITKFIGISLVKKLVPSRNVYKITEKNAKQLVRLKLFMSTQADRVLRVYC